MIPQEPKIEKLEVDSDSDIEKTLEKTRNVKDT